MKVILADYDPDWPARFEDEKQRLLPVLAHGPARFEHIGSTSVPGLIAKPIIDIMIGLEDFARADGLVELIAARDYTYVARYEQTMPDRRYFFRTIDGRDAYHIHMVGEGGEFWTRHLAFRDYLRAHPETAREYGELKRELARREWRDGNEYADAKTDFIRGVEARALKSFSRREPP